MGGCGWFFVLHVTQEPNNNNYDLKNMLEYFREGKELHNYELSK